MDAKEVILEQIGKSTDKDLAKIFRRGFSLRAVGFSEIADIVLYYLSLQPDIRIIGKGVDMREFFWQTVQKVWDKRRKRYFNYVSDPWGTEPGPAGGCMGKAEHYLVMYPGVFGTIDSYFLWPKDKPGDYGCLAWQECKQKIEKHAFPKLRRKYHRGKLADMLEFAEEVYHALKLSYADHLTSTVVRAWHLEGR